MTKALYSRPGQYSATVFSVASNKFIKADADLKKPAFANAFNIINFNVYLKKDTLSAQNLKINTSINLLIVIGMLKG